MVQKSSSTSSLKMITLKTADAVEFDVEPSIAMEMQTIQSFMEEVEANKAISATIPLLNVNSTELSKIIEYLKHHQFDVEFLKAMKLSELKKFAIAVNYLNVKDLLDLKAQVIADRIQNKSVEFVKSFFGVESDFSPEEEARIREERSWAFEGVDEDDYDEE